MRIESTGLVCSVGLTAKAACAAIRAGIAGFEELPYYDAKGKPLIGSPAAPFPPDTWSSERLIDLLALAISDCLGDLPKGSLIGIPLLIALAERDRPGGGAFLAGRVIQAVEQRVGAAFHPQFSRAIPEGQTAGFRAIQEAGTLLDLNHALACVVCGVDSYLNARSLNWLNQDWRLKTEQNSDGVIPGEAAAAVLISAQSGRGQTPKARISGWGFGSEPAPVLSEAPLLGRGLTEAARLALEQAGLQMHEIDLRLSDATGESYGFREQSLMLSRLLRVRRERLPIWHSADCIGDTGAAAGVCQLVIAAQAFNKGYAPGNRAICFTSAVNGDRAAVVLERD